MIYLARRRTAAVFTAAGVTVTALLPVSPAEAAPNLLKVPGFESLSGGFPKCWQPLTTGRPAGKVSTTGRSRSGKRALQVKLNNAKGGVLGFTQKASCAPSAVVGNHYDLSFHYKSTAKARVVLWRKVTGRGWQRWYTIGALRASDGFRRAKGRVAAVPPGTTALRFSVELTGKGTLIADDAVLTRVPVSIKRSRCVGGKKCKTGTWKVRQASDRVRSIHAVVLPRTGKVLLIAGSGNSDPNFRAGTFTSQIYDPKTGAFKVIATPSDMFCAGHAQLPDGRILIMGGTGNYDRGDGESAYAGLKSSYIFDPVNETYRKTNDMVTGHWYPSATVMGNGDVYSFGGYREYMDRTENSFQTEVFSWSKKRWLGAAATKNYIDWGTYPGMILMQDGRLFYSGSYTFSYPKFRPEDQSFHTAAVFDPKTGNVTEVPGLRRPKERDQSMSLLMPPAQDQRVVIMGGGDVNKLSNTPQGSGDEPHAHNTVDVIDLKSGDPKYRPGKKNLPAGKMYPSLVLMPDGKIFETAGAAYTRRNAVREASIYDPNTGGFQRGIPADPKGRGYHNTAMLLPDGRILAAGGNPADNSFDTSVSIYTPGYLYKNNRPVIKSAPKSLRYGGTGRLSTNGAIARAVLIRPSAVTHSSDPNQRYVDLKVSGNGTRPRVTLDKNRNLTPPGWYMLFTVNADGVPSVAKWVKIS
ncbi:galactose oxidase early set domain-containing protein [Actinocorallia aurantiaca]|uniref:Glyoxal oxidase-like protein n=1 Tax=Actinocorallia aurantiaca TaxID=46204 RepID=A0ABN3UC49_9ACTN